jgi:cytochrome c
MMILRLKLVLIACLLAPAFPAFAQQSPPDSATANEVKALVEKAAALVDQKGKAAFSEMKQYAGQWKQGDAYLFAGDLKGRALFNMGFPKFEGTDTMGLTDSTGKLIVKEQIELAQSKGSGWVNYMWPKAGQTTPLQKWTYIKKVTVDGMPAYIGAGFYPQ